MNYQVWHNQYIEFVQSNKVELDHPIPFQHRQRNIIMHMDIHDGLLNMKRLTHQSYFNWSRFYEPAVRP